MKLKWLVKNNNSGEVIDKTYWGEGDEILIHAQKIDYPQVSQNFLIGKEQQLMIYF